MVEKDLLKKALVERIKLENVYDEVLEKYLVVNINTSELELYELYDNEEQIKEILVQNYLEDKFDAFAGNSKKGTEFLFDIRHTIDDDIVWNDLRHDLDIMTVYDFFKDEEFMSDKNLLNQVKKVCDAHLKSLKNDESIKI